MVYVTGTTSGTTNTGRSGFLEWVKPQLDSTGYVLLDTFTTSAVTNGYVYIYETPTTEGIVYFLASDTNTTLLVGIATGYDLATKKLTGVVPFSSTSVDATGISTLEISPAVSINGAQFLSLNVSSAPYSYWIVVDSKRIVIGTRLGSTDHGVYVGMLSNIPSSVNIPFNHYMGYLDNNQMMYSVGEPNISAAGSGSNYMRVRGLAYGLSTLTPVYGTVPSGRYWVETARNAFGRHGTLTDMMFVAAPSATNGDTVVIDGQNWLVVRSAFTAPSYIPIVKIT